MNNIEVSLDMPGGTNPGIECRLKEEQLSQARLDESIPAELFFFFFFLTLLAISKRGVFAYARCAATVSRRDQSWAVIPFFSFHSRFFFSTNKLF